MNVISVISFCYQILSVYGWRPYEVKITNHSTFSSDENIFVNSTLHSDGSVDVNMEISKVFPGMFARAEAYLDSGSENYEMEIMNRTINLCRFFRDTRYEPVLQLIYKIMLQYGNFPKKCPIEKEKYYIRRLLVNTEVFPPILPEKKGFIKLTFLNTSLFAIGGFNSFYVVAKKYQPMEIH